MKDLALIKIGGSLITDKTKPFTTRDDMMRLVAEGVYIAYEKFPENGFLIANGGGSFGHYLASKEAGDDPQERIDAIHESVVLLNKLLVQHLIEKGLPAASIVPAEHIVAENGVLKDFNVEEIEDILSLNSMPVLFGDIVADGTEKGMIFSTEMLFECIAKELYKEYELTVFYAGETEGVLDATGNTIPEITTRSWEEMGRMVEAPKGYDVTGGMTHKIESALHMTQYSKNIRILSGKDPQNISAALSGADVGTKIVS
jgi:isopentenyl phosphate kinase